MTDTRTTGTTGTTRTTSILSLLLAILAILAGCGGEEDGGSPSRDGRYVCEAIIEAACSRVSCTMQPQFQCMQSAEDRGVCDQQVIKDESKLAECLDYLENATCEEIRNNFEESVCSEVLL